MTVRIYLAIVAVGGDPSAPGSGGNSRLGPGPPETVGAEGPARTGFTAGADPGLRPRKRRIGGHWPRFAGRSWGPRRRGSERSKDRVRLLPRGGSRSHREQGFDPADEWVENPERVEASVRLPRGFFCLGSNQGPATDTTPEGVPSEKGYSNSGSLSAVTSASSVMLRLGTSVAAARTLMTAKTPRTPSH